MTLARIITHSDFSARELAFHLLGRGYAVEIVSPDSIPDNFADLELRVDADSGDQLVASLAAYEGQGSSALELVGLVKTPLEKTKLTPSAVGELPCSLDNPVEIKVAPSIADIKASADSRCSPPQPILLRAQAKDALDDEPCLGLGTTGPGTALCSEEAANLSPSEEPSPSAPSDPAQLEAISAEPELVAAVQLENPVEPLSYFVRQTSSIAMPFPGPSEILPTWEQQALDRPIEWKSIVPAALTLAAVVLLSLFLAFGVRASAKASVSSAPAQRAAASTPAKASIPASEKVVTTGKPSPDLHSTDRYHTASRRASQIAPDTVTYLDDRYRPAPKPKPLHARKSSMRHATSEVAAEATVYLNSATSPKPAK